MALERPAPLRMTGAADAAAALALALTVTGPATAPDGGTLGRRHCVYCGRPSMHAACFLHRDLLRLDARAPTSA